MTFLWCPSTGAHLLTQPDAMEKNSALFHVCIGSDIEAIHIQLHLYHSMALYNVLVFVFTAVTIKVQLYPHLE